MLTGLQLPEARRWFGGPEQWGQERRPTVRWAFALVLFQRVLLPSVDSGVCADRLNRDTAVFQGPEPLSAVCRTVIRTPRNPIDTAATAIRTLKEDATIRLVNSRKLGPRVGLRLFFLIAMSRSLERFLQPLSRPLQKPLFLLRLQLPPA